MLLPSEPRVAQEKVSTATKHVIKCSNRQREGVPSILSRQQAVTNSSNLTLKYDGTTTKLGHLVEVELATDNYSCLIGVQDQATAKADQYDETIENSIRKIYVKPWNQ